MSSTGPRSLLVKGVVPCEASARLGGGAAPTAGFVKVPVVAIPTEGVAESVRDAHGVLFHREVAVHFDLVDRDIVVRHFDANGRGRDGQTVLRQIEPVPEVGVKYRGVIRLVIDGADVTHPSSELSPHASGVATPGFVTVVTCRM